MRVALCCPFSHSMRNGFQQSLLRLDLRQHPADDFMLKSDASQCAQRQVTLSTMLASPRGCRSWSTHVVEWHLEGGVGPDEVRKVLAAEGGCSRAGQAGRDLISHTRQELLRTSP